MSQLNFSLSHTSEPAHRLIMRGDNNLKTGKEGDKRGGMEVRKGREREKREGM